MEQLNNLDVIFLVIVGISALVGIARGMTKEMLSIIGWVLAAAALFYLVPMLNPFMENYVSSKWLASIVSGMVILLVFCIIWVLTVDKLASLIRSSKLSALDRIFGFVFGTARGALIVILITLLISTLMPEDSKKGVFEKSILFAQANECVEPLQQMIPQSWVDAFKAQSERFGFGKKKAEEKAEEATEENTEKATEENKQNGSPETPADGSEQISQKPSLGETLDSIDSNIDVLQKGGEALFNQLAQPKTAKEEDKSDGISADDLVSDLDKLLDVLEDKMVTTDEENGAMKKK